MNTKVLFRLDRDIDVEEEKRVCEQFFETTFHRSDTQEGDLIIPRYCALPFYTALEDEVKHLGGRLINTHREHQYVADISNWYPDLRDYTPRTWESWYRIPETEHGYILKGKTNSRKWKWKTHMYAKTSEDIRAVAQKLYDDPLISNQGVVLREYVPLMLNEEIGINGLPFTHEWRFFFYREQLLAGGYYWSTAENLLDTPQDAIDFAKEVAAIVAPNIPFFVIDVARTAEGALIVIELNDGQMSGLSECDPGELYQNLKEVL